VVAKKARKTAKKKTARKATMFTPETPAIGGLSTSSPGGSRIPTAPGGRERVGQSRPARTRSASG